MPAMRKVRRTTVPKLFWNWNQGCIRHGWWKTSSRQRPVKSFLSTPFCGSSTMNASVAVALVLILTNSAFFTHSP